MAPHHAQTLSVDLPIASVFFPASSGPDLWHSYWESKSFAFPFTKSRSRTRSSTEFVETTRPIEITLGLTAFGFWGQTACTNRPQPLPPSVSFFGLPKAAAFEAPSTSALKDPEFASDNALRHTGFRYWGENVYCTTRANCRRAEKCWGIMWNGPCPFALAQHTEKFGILPNVSSLCSSFELMLFSTTKEEHKLETFGRIPNFSVCCAKANGHGPFHIRLQVLILYA